MLRWLLLLAAFLLWIGSLAWIQRAYGPKPPSPQSQANAEMLKNIFGERAVLQSTWRIFMLPPADEQALRYRPSQLNPRLLERERELRRLRNEQLGVPAEALELGTLKSRVTPRGETQAEQSFELNLHHLGFYLPFPHLLLKGQGFFSLDQGLESFSMALNAGNDLTLATHGVRDGPHLKVTVQTRQYDLLLGQLQFHWPVSALCAPSLDPLPLGYRPEIREGDRWEVLGVNLLDQVWLNGQLGLRTQMVRVTGRRMLRLHGKEAQVFEVEGEGGEDGAEPALRAWYSADGHPLRIQCVWLNKLPVMLLRNEEDFTRP